MKPRILWYRRLSIATKQFIFLFTSTLLIFGTLLWNNQSDSEKLFRGQVIYDSQKLLDSANLFLDSYVENIQSILLSLSMKEQLFLSGNEEEINKLLRTYAEINSTMVKTIYMINNDGEVYSSHKVFYEILGNPQIDNLYQLSMKNYGGINWSEPYHSPMSAGNTVGFVSPITNNNEMVGTVVVEIDLEQLSHRLAPLLLNKNQTFLIVTSSGEVVTTDIKKNSNIPYILSEYPRQPSEQFIQQITKLSNGVHELNNLNTPLVSIKSDKNRLGWSLISLIEENVFYAEVNKLFENFRNAGIILIFILFISSFSLSRYFTNPVRRLVKKMDNVTSLKSMSSIPVIRYDEIGRLVNSFNSMLERIQYLFKENQRIEQLKKEYELKMLQSQIGPHFLYNTLACIGSLAKQNKTDEVRATIRALIGLLSFSFDKRSELVSLVEELESVELYSQIQKMRYGNKFSLHINVDSAAYRCKLPKLILQPFVENAIFHGISLRETPGKIEIKGTISGDKLKLFIRDNGIGMDRDKLKRLLKQPIKTNVSNSFNSIGVKNVHERIRMNYGDIYGVRINSIENVGTVVRIIIPIGGNEAF